MDAAIAHSGHQADTPVNVKAVLGPLYQNTQEFLSSCHC